MIYLEHKHLIFQKSMAEAAAVPAPRARATALVFWMRRTIGRPQPKT